MSEKVACTQLVKYSLNIRVRYSTFFKSWKSFIRLHHTCNFIVDYTVIPHNHRKISCYLTLNITFTSKYNVNYKDGDTEKMLWSEFNVIHQSMGRERERKRGLSTLFAKPYLTALHEQNISL